MSTVEIIQGAKALSISDSGAALTVDCEQKLLHDGYSFIATDLDEDLDTGETLLYLLRAPLVETIVDHVHYKFSAIATSSCKIELRKTPVYSASGTAMTLLNRNGNSSLTSNSAIFKTPTLSGAVGSGSLIANFIVGTSNIAGIGGLLPATQFIPETAEEYLLRITPYADNTKINPIFETMEEPV